MTEPIHLRRRDTVGMYATDAEGRAWCTFAVLMGDARFAGDFTLRCAVCGLQLLAGWRCHVEGEPDRFVCADHVVVEGEAV